MLAIQRTAERVASALEAIPEAVMDALLVRGVIERNQADPPASPEPTLVRRLDVTHLGRYVWIPTPRRDVGTRPEEASAAERGDRAGRLIGIVEGTLVRQAGQDPYSTRQLVLDRFPKPITVRLTDLIIVAPKETP